MDSRRRAIMGIAKSGGRLPSEYQKVEYLQSTGEQYIDTGISPSNIGNNFKMYVELYVFQRSGRNGCRTAGQWFICPNVQGYSGYAELQCGTEVISINIPYTDEKHLYGIDCVNQIGIYDSNQFSFNNTTPRDINVNIFLFAFNIQNSSVGNYIIGKLYSCYIYDGQEYVRSFVPCYRKADNKPGLYDLVNDVFYTNANTGASQDFIVGPNV